jgi:hypothetical protein
VTQAPQPRNDVEFERATSRLRQLYAETFAERRTLVRSAAGRLQLLRLNPDLTADHVFTDPDAARTWLEQGESRRRGEC